MILDGAKRLYSIVSSPALYRTQVSHVALRWTRQIMCLHHLVFHKPWRTMCPNLPADHHNPLWLLAAPMPQTSWPQRIVWELQMLQTPELKQHFLFAALVSWRWLAFGGRFHLIFLWIGCLGLKKAFKFPETLPGNKKTPDQYCIFIGTSDCLHISAQLLVVLQCIFQNQGRAEVHSAHR